MSTSTLYLGAASTTSSVFTVGAGKTLCVVESAVNPTDAVNKGVLDIAVGALTTVINTITGSDFHLAGAFDQLPEIMTAVTTEQTARAAADTAEHDARVAADDLEITTRAAAITTEANARSAADISESNARTAADDAEAVARTAADAALQIQISDVNIVPFTSTIYADGNQPAPLPFALVNAGHQGWYYKNSNASGTNKINWYMTNKSGGAPKMNLTVGQINEINMPVTLISKASTPFITIYTAPFGNYSSSNPTAYTSDVTKDAASWYHAKVTYTVDGDSAGADYGTLVNGGQYLFRARVAGSTLTANYPSYSNIDLLPSVVASSTKGNFANDQTILLIAIGTDSSSAVNNVEFVVKHFELRTSLGNKKMLFANESVMSNYLLQKLDALYSTFYHTSIVPV
jgi:hypothetical protein